MRNLEREIGNVFRNVAVRIAEGGAQRVTVGPDDLAAILGPRKFEAEVAMRSGVPGVATGLAWTPVGGDILFIEATRMPGAGKLILTGQLGDVMKESAQAALSLVKARSQQLGIAPDVLEKSDIHVHVPAGATPEGRPERGRGDVRRARVAADRPAGAQRRRDDRRDQPARARAADRRRQGEGAGRAARRASAR